MNLEILINKIIELSKEKDGSIDKSLKNANLKPNVVANLKSGSYPSVDKIYALAQYFNVTTDYLLTGKKSIVLDKEHIELFDKFDKLNDKAKGSILGYMNCMLADTENLVCATKVETA